MTRPTWRQLLAREKPLVLAGAHDALSARLIEIAGFQDVLWCAPFDLYLRDAWPTFRASPGRRDRALPMVSPVSRR